VPSIHAGLALRIASVLNIGQGNAFLSASASGPAAMRDA
jgi:hypothetical protein